MDYSINSLIARSGGETLPAWDYLRAQKDVMGLETGKMQNELARQQLEAEPMKQKLTSMMLELKDLGLDLREKAMRAGPTVKIPFTLGGKNYTVTGPSETVAEIGNWINRDPRNAMDKNLIPWAASKGVSLEEVSPKAPVLGTPEHLKAITAEEEAKARVRQQYKDPEKENEATAAMKTFEMQRWGKLVPELRGKPEYLEALKESKKTPYTEQLEEQAKRARETHKQSIRKEFYGAKEVETYQTLSQQFGVMEEAMKESKKGGNLVAVDQALITIMNKMMDPQSVVRESEYARTPGDLALMNRIKGAFQKLARGGAGLTQEDREAISTMGKKYYEVSQRKYKAKYHEYAGYAVNAGYEPDQVLNPADKGQTGVQNPGDVEDGYRWKGGDKSDPDNWEPVK